MVFLLKINWLCVCLYCVYYCSFFKHYLYSIRILPCWKKSREICLHLSDPFLRDHRNGTVRRDVVPPFRKNEQACLHLRWISRLKVIEMKWWDALEIHGNRVKVAQSRLNTSHQLMSSWVTLGFLLTLLKLPNLPQIKRSFIRILTHQLFK